MARCKLDENLAQFNKRCSEFRYLDSVRPRDTWAWLLYAQRHRLKTRLLDRTSNPLVALYYAVENVLSHACDEEDFGAVWAVKVHSDHFLGPAKLRHIRPCDISSWVMINPIPVTTRLARQSGKFSFHPDAEPEPLNELPRRESEDLVQILIGVPPRPETTRTIRRHLGIINVHHAHMFQNPDGIAAFINVEWRDLQW